MQAYLKDLPEHGAGRRPPGPRQEHLGEKQRQQRHRAPNMPHPPPTGVPGREATRVQACGMRLGQATCGRGRHTLPSPPGRSAGSFQARL